MRVSLSLVAILTAPVAAVAQTGEDQAREAFARGERAYEREVYTEAEDAFRESYELFEGERRALILFNLAMVVEAQGGRDVEALELWRRFRTEAASIADAPQLVRADDRMRELEARMERRRGHAGGQSVHPVGPIVLGAGGAALLAGAIVGGIALGQDSDFRGRCDDLSMCPPDLRPEYDEMRTMSAAADALWIAGGIVAATGLVLTLVVREGPNDRVTTASCGLGACTLQGRF